MFRREALAQVSPGLFGRPARARAGHAPGGARRMPVLLQGELAECGLACLAMVAGHWGRALDLPTLRRRFEISLRGSGLKSLIDMARALGLVSRPVKLELEQLRELPRPCVLHWDMNHFVVLADVQGDRLVLHDPAVGRVRMRLAKASAHFTGVALELRPGPDFQATDERARVSLRAVLGPIVGLRRGLARGLCLALALQAGALAAPFYLQWVVDRALPRADRDQLVLLALAFLGLGAARALVGALRSWTTATLSTSANYQWLGNAFSHLMNLPLAYFEKRSIADIVSRFNSIQSIQRSLTTQFIEALVDGALALAALAVMANYSVRLTAVICAAMTAYGGLRWFAFRRLREATAEQLLKAARQQSHFLESARGIVSLRLFDRTQERCAGWMNRLAEQQDAELRIARQTVTFQAAHVALQALQHVLVVWLLALTVLEGRLSVGMLFAFVAYKEHFDTSVSALIDKAFEFRMLGLHVERVADIVLAPAEREAPDTLLPLDDADAPPGIELRGLGFRYADGEPFVLRGLDLVVPPGQCIAITGPSGSGKTTLVKLLLGLLTPTEGEILIGGLPLARLGAARHRRLVAAVMQDEPLFAGSIADNIAFFDPEPDTTRIAECARQAALEAEVLAMPMGWHTLVGEGGCGLSGGQKQRLMLARALYKQPHLLVLDEATSHLDVASEARVNAAIRACPRTRLLVAHRPETIAMADRVVVLEDGHIVRDLMTVVEPASQAEGLAAAAAGA
jgi:ATP-binding cassette subfamily B protein RaxB